jgi:hypothetical protein
MESFHVSGESDQADIIESKQRTSMKIKAYATIFAVIALMLFSALGAQRKEL